MVKNKYFIVKSVRQIGHTHLAGNNFQKKKRVEVTTFIVFNKHHKDVEIFQMEEIIQNKSKLENLFDFGREANVNRVKSHNGYCHKTTELIFWILFSFIGITIFIGNSFTCIVFITSKRLRRNFMNVFLVSLACLDVFMSIFVVPFYPVYCSRGCKYSLIKYCWLFIKTKDWVLIATTFNICAITYDRYLAVILPLHYGAKMTKRRVMAILAGVWTLPALVAGIRSALHHTKNGDELRYANKLYDTVLVVVFVIFSILVLSVVNLKIMMAIKKHNEREITEQSRRQAWKATVEETKQRKGTRACIFVVFVFMACWLPRIVYNFSYIIKPPGLASPLFLRLAFLSLFLQSAANPFIYSFYRSEFRTAALRLIKWRKDRRITIFVELSAKSKDTRPLDETENDKI